MNVLIQTHLNPPFSLSLSLAMASIIAIRLIFSEGRERGRIAKTFFFLSSLLLSHGPKWRGGVEDYKIISVRRD